MADDSIKFLGEQVFGAVKRYIDDAIQRMDSQVKTLREFVQSIPPGRDGKDGVKGDRGEKGETGLAGLTGEQGLQGPPGERGEKGEQGLAGKDGRDGVDGARGERGEKGEAGIVGEKGESGMPGQAGRDGVDGTKGERGEKGEQGPGGPIGLMGKDGVDGRDGINGKDGTPGRDGKDADPVDYVAVNNLIRDLVKQIPVPKDGRDGVDGKDGARGEKGERGEKGTDGLNGRDGAAGEKGVDGINGAEGRDGRDGKDGAPGRDALRIDIQGNLDGTRSYPKGTYVSYRGGTLCAQRYTDPLTQEPDLEKAGWLIIVEGIAECSQEFEDEGRVWLNKITMTSGRVLVQKTKTTSLIYRGTWEQRLYERGDVVTYDGGMLYCVVPQTEKRPDQNAQGDWKVCVRRGRDGKDGGERITPPLKTVKLR